jgi:hypothetical protein
MIGALLYLRLTSLQNMVAYRIRRLKQPRYLVGAVVAGAYIYFSILRRAGFARVAGGPLSGMGATIVAFICVFISATALLRIAYAWISPPPTPGLQFSEAEIGFLFPAPLSRRTLIHFRLLSMQLAILFTAVLMALVFNRYAYGGGSRLMRAAGLWVVLSTFGLNVSGTNLTVARLKETSPRHLLWRAVAVSLIVLYAIAVVWSAVTVVNAESFDSLSPESGLGGLIGHLLSSSPLRWLILPFAIVFAPYFATSLGGFLAAMIPALAVLGIHYYCVSSTEYRFEDGSIVLAQKRTAIREAMALGQAPKVGAFKPKAQPGPFPLSASGPLEIAFLWKNLLSMRSSILSRRTIVVAITVTIWLSFALGPLLTHGRGRGSTDFYGPIIVVFCAIAAGYTLLLGPQIARQDLRTDLPNADILKTFPVESWRLALGEMLAPAAILSLVLWFLIIVCSFMVDSRGELEWLTPGVRITAGLCLAVAAPVLCIVQLIVPNLIMLLLPGWFQSSRSRGGGIELFGQRVILGIAQLLIALLVAVPGALAAVVIIFCSQHWLGVSISIVLASLVVLPIMAGEVAVGLWWIGERFDRFDPSTEIK